MNTLNPAFYRNLYDDSPVSIWVEDFSIVLDEIKQIKAGGVEDIRAYFLTYPERFLACISKMRVVDVNQATLDIYKAENKEHLLANLNTVFADEALPCLMESIVAHSEGKKSFSGNGVNYDLNGNKLYIRISWNVPSEEAGSLNNVIVVIQDMTELAQIRTISEGREALFRAVFEQSSEGMLLLDENGRILLVNNAFQSLSGIGDNYIIDNKIWELYELIALRYSVESQIDLSEDFFSSFFANPEAGLSTFEYRFKDSSSKSHVHKVNIFPIQSTEEKLFAVITTDLSLIYRSAETARMLHKVSHAVNVDSSLDELFKTIHKSLATLMDTTNFYIALYDAKTNLISFPYHVDEMDEDGSPIEADSESSLTAQIISEAQTLFLTEEAIEERIASNKHMGIASKNFLGVPLMLSNQVIGALVVQSYSRIDLYDNDDRLLLESISEQIAFALRKKQNDENLMTMIQAIEQAGEGILIFSPEGYIKYVNSVFEKATGYRRIELIDKPIDALPFDSESEKNLKNSWLRVKSYQPWRGKLQFIRKDLTKLVLDMIVKPVLDNENHLSSIIASCKDVTYEILREEQLKKTQRLEAIGRLTGGIAHDFNNVLSAIIGYTELASDDVAPGSDTASNLSEVLKSSLRAKEMISHLLAFSKQEESKTEIIELVDHVKESVRFLKSFLPRSIKIQESYLAEKSTAVAVSGQIHQIIINFGTNAMHAMKNQDGILEIKVEQISFKSKDMVAFPELDQCHYLLISVTDNGCGIDDSQLDRIFDPYYTTKGANEGTGLGLSIVHGIVVSHRGAIRVESKVGVGTTFKVYLPLYEADSWYPQAKEAEEEVNLHGSETIMFVDDEPMLVNIFKQGLGRLGYKLECFTDSRKAQEYYTKHPEKIDLLVTDTTMPHVNGLDLALGLLKIRPEIPIVLCTGFTTLISAEEARRKGIKEFIMKPYKIKDLAASIRDLLDEKK